MNQIVTKLDLKDRKILFELEQDARQSLQQIAKKVGLSKEAVFHRIKNLEKEGIIKKYLTEIDIYKLGYQWYPLLLKFKDITPKLQEEMFNYLKQSKCLTWMTACEGNWDANLTLFAKNNYDINLFLEGFTEKYGQYLAEKQLHIIAEQNYFKRGFWLNKPITQIISTSKGKETQLDFKDLEILQILSDHARMPLVEIARRLKLSAKVVAYKIKKLEKEKVIQGSHLLVDFSKLGYKFYKVWFSLKNVTPEKRKKLFTYFQIVPNIIWATRLIGKYDLSIEMEVEDVAQFRKIIDDIKQEFHELINEHESILIFEEKVLNYMPK
ncbi:MAG: winged helix-turn-helix transcriptional regulator [Candidatus Woesearchaeota archaeon]